MMADKTDFLLALKKRLALGEITPAEYNALKTEIMADEKGSTPIADTFDARATFQGIGIGSVLRDRYEIILELGRGGMGVVYRAKDLELETVVAVKVLNEELARDGRSVRNLMEEAKISMRLTHPHIMRLINFESDDRRKFLVMEYIEGETLECKLAKEGKIAEPVLVQIAADICDGLGYAHKQKIIHRDIKPSNIMLTSAGEVKIMDFGIARVMKDSMTMMTGRMTTGTLIYMSPEQIEGRDVDGRSDLYSLGVMLYELAAGSPPFYQGDITHQHLKVEPKKIEGVSARLNEIVLKCLEKEKAKRYGSADELRAVLEGRQETESERAVKSARERTQREAVEREASARQQATLEAEERAKTEREAAERGKTEREAAAREKERQLRIQAMEEEARRQEEMKREEARRNEASVPGSTQIPTNSSGASRVGSKKWTNAALWGILALFVVILGYVLINEGNQSTPSSPGGADQNSSVPLSSVAIEPEMVRIDGGTFQMGSNSSEAFSVEKPAHQVTVSTFWIGKYEVTQAEWNSVMPTNPSHFKGDNLPVESVSWNDAKEYIRKLNEKTNKGYRLPTEAEWEYTCRGKTQGDRYSEDINSIAWYSGNSENKTHYVGTRNVNAWGLYDMLGNVWEWCEDRYGSYLAESATNPKGPEEGARRVFRGGSWGDVAQGVRASFRNFNAPSLSNYYLGFRLAKD